MKAKVREKRSKVAGQKAILEQINTQAHQKLHEDGIGHGAPTISTFASTYKWGSDR